MSSDGERQRPAWAERLLRERKARNWTQADVVRAMRTFSDVPLPSGLDDQWKRWERGRNKPDEFYRPIIAATFGTVVESLFTNEHVTRAPLTDDLLISRSGMDTHELVQRVRQSSIDESTVEALNLTVEQLCCDYTQRDPYDLITDARSWLGRMTNLLNERLTFPQHRDVLDAVAWLTLLTGCLEWDTGQRSTAEATRLAAMQVGEEASNLPVLGWAHEIHAWFALTNSRFGDVIEAAQAGQDAAPGRSVSVQLYAQEAKAWARMGNQRQTIQALEKGRVLLDSLPYPERPDNHFVIEPDKYDFYAMDCYRLIHDDTLAAMTARDVIHKTTGPDGRSTSPMRQAEAILTLGIVAAREGDLDAATTYGERALEHSRRSQPSLLMVGSELDRELSSRFPSHDETKAFHDALLEATGTAS